MSGIQISMRHFLGFFFYLPCLTFIVCIGITILKDFEESTRTHCNVFNFLPSVSEAIGSFQPQRFIWRSSFTLDTIPRYIIGYLQLKHLLNRDHVASPERYRLIQRVNSCIHFLELTFLLLLTYVSTNEIRWIHVWGFGGFVTCSLLHMICTLLIDYYWRRTETCDLNEKEKEIRSKRLRWFIVNILSFFLSLYFYFRHTHFCEPYIYSWFCFCEYIVVGTNIGYHSVIRDEWDQPGKQIQVL